VVDSYTSRHELRQSLNLPASFRRRECVKIATYLPGTLVGTMLPLAYLGESW
jgi:hypothetical protein